MKALKRSENHSEMLTFQKNWNIRSIAVQPRFHGSKQRGQVVGQLRSASLEPTSLGMASQWTWDFEFQAYPGFIVMNTLNLALPRSQCRNKMSFWLLIHSISISVWFCLIIWFCLLYVCKNQTGCVGFMTIKVESNLSMVHVQLMAH